jgi:hypothetical protein
MWRNLLNKVTVKSSNFAHGSTVHWNLVARILEEKETRGRRTILQRIAVNVSFFLPFSISISTTCGYCV